MYTPPGIQSEIATLDARSIVPLHPLVAAIQSIGVLCYRELEMRTTSNANANTMLYMGGLILFPAWVIHGLFDFVLFVLCWQSFMVTMKTITTITMTKTTVILLMEKTMVTWIKKVAYQPFRLLLVYIFIVVLIYYIVQANAQRKRLMQQEAGGSRNAIVNGGGGATTNLSNQVV